MVAPLRSVVLLTATIRVPHGSSLSTLPQAHTVSWDLSWLANDMFTLHGKVNGKEEAFLLSCSGMTHCHHFVYSGWSVSLSSDGSILAVGGPLDGSLYAPRIGSTWIFQFNGSTYKQLGEKLVGEKFVGYSSQGGHEGK